jgi:hypothetical protein
MIWRSIFIAVLLFAGYDLYINKVQPKFGKGQHQFQQNVIKAQNYTDKNQSGKIVLVGSSLTDRLNQEMLPDSFYNMSFAGGSIYTGLDIILHTPSKPRLVLVEMNIANRPADPGFSEKLFTPVLYPLRKEVPALREEAQPVNLLPALLNRKMKNSNSMGEGYREPDKSMLDNYDNYPNKKDLPANMLKLKSMVDQLQNEGVRVIFYRMPVHCSLTNRPLYTDITAAFAGTFPASQYKYLPEPACSKYHYSDGEHLAAVSKADFINWFLGQLKSVK